MDVASVLQTGSGSLLSQAVINKTEMMVKKIIFFMIVWFIG